MKRRLVRIVFELEPDAWHGSATERLWGEGVSEGRYRLRNSPFYAFGVSNEDIVFGREREGRIYFAGVSIRGGHSTYRLRLHDHDLDAPAFRQAWTPLEGLGCSYEEGPILAVDVPASADIYAVYDLLEAGMTAHVWDFEEGHCGHPLRASGET